VFNNNECKMVTTGLYDSDASDIPPVTCPPPPWMNGKKRGATILKNGGESGNVGGNLISKMIEFIFLFHCRSIFRS
jgi:hypothetical protein